MKSIQIKEIKKYQTEDGTVFDTEKEALEYVQLTNTGLYKSLVERVQKLEQELVALRTEVSTKSWFRDVQINRPPYQRPDMMLFDQQAYNPATGQPEQKD